MNSKNKKIKFKLSLRWVFLTLTILSIISAAQAATFNVTNTNDSGSGSLRQAVLIANNFAGADIINFTLSNCPCTITLTSGELLILDDLTIQGLGADQLTVSGNNASRVLNIQELNIFTSSVNAVTVEGVSISGGNASQGGGIFNEGILTVSNSSIHNNTSTSDGGGVSNQNGSILTVFNSVVFNNLAGGYGGGIVNTNGSLLTLINTTVSSNLANREGGGIDNFGANLKLVNSTVVGNRCDADGNSLGTDKGGGISAFGTEFLDNSIIAGNYRFVVADTTRNDIGAQLIDLAQSSLIGDFATSGSVNNGNNGNIVGIDVNTVFNTTLADNGGTTLTHALVAGSPALNTGNNTLAVNADNNPLTTDQRGAGFPRLVDATVDMGAFEGLGQIVNGDPILSNVAVSSSISENGFAALSGNISDADAGNAFTLTVDWGDGSAPQVFNYPAGTTSFNETHQYADDAPTASAADNFTINLTLDDKDGGSDTALTVVTVTNLAPTLSVISINPSTINVGGTATLSGIVNDVGAQDSHAVQVNWGDGSPATTLNFPPAGVSAFSASHQYAHTGIYTVSITASDDDTGTVSSNAGVTVNATVAPNAPTGLSATAVSASQINLTWTDNSNNETGFIIERCKNKSCNNFVQIAQTIANVTTFSDTGLFANTQYHYRVHSLNYIGNSAYSNRASAKTLR